MWLDEYPFASTVEGGLGASLRLVPAWEQRIQAVQISSLYSTLDIEDKFIVNPISKRYHSDPYGYAYYVINPDGSLSPSSTIKKPLYAPGSLDLLPQYSPIESPQLKPINGTPIVIGTAAGAVLDYILEVISAAAVAL